MEKFIGLFRGQRAMTMLSTLDHKYTKSQGDLLRQNVNVQMSYDLICGQGQGKNLSSKTSQMTSLYLGMEKRTPRSNQVGRNQVSVW